MSSSTLVARGLREHQVQAVHSADAGNEIQAPMGVVILGGLLSATTLNMLVLPVLYRRFAAR